MSVETAILRALEFYELEDAAFLAELYHAEAATEQSLFLLATCRYRLRETHRAYHLLKSAPSLSHLRARLLLARCCLDLKKYCEVVFAFGLHVDVLANFDEKIVATIDEDFGAIAADVLLLLAKTSSQSGHENSACGYFRACIYRNPLLWSAFEGLCHHDQSGIDTSGIFASVEVTISTVPGQEVTSAVTTETARNPVAVQENVAFTPGAPLSSTPMEDPLLPTVPSSATFAARRPSMNRRNMLGVEQTGSLTPLSPSYALYGQRAPRQLELEPSSGLAVDKGNIVDVTPTEPAQQRIDNIKKEQASASRRGRRRVTGDVKTGLPASQARQTRASGSVPGSALRCAQPSLTPTPKASNVRVTRSVTRMRQEQATPAESMSSRKPVREQKRREGEERVAVAKAGLAVNESAGKPLAVVEVVKSSSSELWQLGQVLQQLAVGYLALREFDLSKSIRTFNSLQDKYRQIVWVREQVARAHFENNNYKKAVTEFKELRKTDPYSLSGMPIYSSCLWHIGGAVELSGLATNLIDIFRLKPETWCVAGNCLSLAELHTKAMALLQRAIQIDDQYTYAHILMAEEFMVLEKPDLDAASESFSRALACDSRSYRAWSGLGRVQFQREDYSAAAMHFWSALKINPNCPVILVHVALAYKAMNDIKMSQRLLLKACRLQPDLPVAQFHLAALLACEGKFAESLILLHRLKEQAPKEAAVFHLLGMVYQKQGDQVQASIYQSKAVNLDPKSAYLKVSLGRLLENQGNGLLESESPTTPSFLSQGSVSTGDGRLNRSEESNDLASSDLMLEGEADGDEGDDLSGFSLAGVELSGQVSDSPSINMSMD